MINSTLNENCLINVKEVPQTCSHITTTGCLALVRLLRVVADTRYTKDAQDEDGQENMGD